MAWTGQTFSVGQILTAAQMTNLQNDITALANGDSGAPDITFGALAAGGGNSPPGLLYLGDESDGAIVHSSSGNIASNIYQCTDFTINSGVTMTLTESSGGYLVIIATGTVTISGTISGTGRGAKGAPQNCTSTNRCSGGIGSAGGYFGSSGGGGGEATVAYDSHNGGAGGNCSGYSPLVPGADTTANGGAGGSGDTGAGGSAGEQIPTAGYGKLSLAGIDHLLSYCIGAGGGSGGGEGQRQGAGGDGGAGILIIAKDIVFAASGIINTGGANGSSSGHSGTGGGGGGGGGTVLFISNTLTNSGTVNQSGGAGGVRQGTSVYGGAGASGRTLTVTI